MVGGLTSFICLPFERRACIEDRVLGIRVGWLRNARVKLASANQRVLMRRAVVADQDNVRSAAHFAEPASGLLGSQNTILRGAPLNIDTSQVRVGAQRGLGSTDSGRGIPFRGIFNGLEIWIVGFEILETAVGAILPIYRGEIPLQDRDMASRAAGMLGDVFAGVLTICHIVSAHGHKN